MKKILLGAMIGTALLSASQLVQLPDGKYVLLEPSGKWEEVTVVKKDGQTIILKKDGTWMRHHAPATHTSSIEAHPNNMATVLPQKSELPDFAKPLIGRWSTKDGSRAYTFDENFHMTILRDGEKEESDFTIASVDAKRRILRIGVGKRFKIGPVSFGSKIIKFRLSEDGNMLEDLTTGLEEMREIRLYKVQ